VKNWFPPLERGKANACWVVGTMIGPAIAMPLLTWVISTMGWRDSFFVLSAIGFIPLCLLWFYTTDHPYQHKGINKAELEHIEAALKIEAEAEAKMGHATLWENLKVVVVNYRFWLLTVHYFCIVSIFWGMLAWLPSYLKAVRGFTWSAMGTWAALPYVIGAASVMLFGWLSDKAGRRAPFSTVSLLGAAAGIYFGATVPDNTIAAILISLGIASIGIGLPSAWALLQQMVPGKAVGAGAGLMNGLANGGSAFAPVMIGFFIQTTGSYVGGLMFLVALGILGATCAFILALQKY